METPSLSGHLCAAEALRLSVQVAHVTGLWFGLADDVAHLLWSGWVKVQERLSDLMLAGPGRSDCPWHLLSLQLHCDGPAHMH